ncbi:RimK family alpha-L-glutamate ligase [Streptomyces orinoci]|uniref:RimK family alpha-L-glutamate ligase n=1 Tax=Streptomyces orinoci TaxID=67339 RepID=A0ABV3K2I6_STRON|nr:RimK family alpha-L-glutamate ligase [Streptomyces orinoci]
MWPRPWRRCTSRPSRCSRTSARSPGAGRTADPAHGGRGDPGRGPEGDRGDRLPGGGQARRRVLGRLLSKVNDRDAAETLIEHKQAMRAPQHSVFYVQELIDKPGRDIRVIVLGDQAVAAVHRGSEHWITNTARGAATERCELTPELAKPALRAAEAAGGGMPAVDLIERSTGEVLVTEVNHTMEFHGLASATEVDIAGLTVSHVQEVLSR